MSTLAALRQLIRQGYQARPEDLSAMVMQAASLLGVASLVIYVVDHRQRELLPLIDERGRSASRSLSTALSPAGRTA